ncbi:MAG TPA: hypothetical protein VD997_18050 [Phycisphaerales bacterium]|nr:hypothetical protein [Phycisphaerales bacterium]
MDPSERWRLVEKLMDFAWDQLKRLPPEELERRLAIDLKRHDDSDAEMLRRLRRAS